MHTGRYQLGSTSASPVRPRPAGQQGRKGDPHPRADVLPRPGGPRQGRGRRGAGAVQVGGRMRKRFPWLPLTWPFGRKRGSAMHPVPPMRGLSVTRTRLCGSWPTRCVPPTEQGRASARSPESPPERETVPESRRTGSDRLAEHLASGRLDPTIAVSRPFLRAEEGTRTPDLPLTLAAARPAELLRHRRPH
jgi:hypothetical protein